MRKVIIVVGLLALTVLPASVLAQDDECPKGYSNDDCDQWGFERADKILTEAIASKIAERSKMTTNADLVEEIKSTALAAHRAWLAFRDAECKSYVAASFISARTERGRNASCLLSMTEQRVAQVKRLEPAGRRISATRV
jgi:uncharacterized protein YecT (DUF1311 family)